jgi:hypothetical protein
MEKKMFLPLTLSSPLFFLFTARHLFPIPGMEPEWEGEEAGGSASRLDPAGAAGAALGRRRRRPAGAAGATWARSFLSECACGAARGRPCMGGNMGLRVRSGATEPAIAEVEERQQCTRSRSRQQQASWKNQGNINAVI